MKRVAIVGCTHAGVYAATTILEKHPEWQVDIFERHDNISFLSCGIALWAGNHVSDPKKMFYSSPEEIRSYGANVFMQHEVVGADLKHDVKVLRVRNLSDMSISEHEYDRVVIATGSRPYRPQLPGIDSPRVLTCKTWDDAKRIHDKVAKAKCVMVVGAGYIGAELAEQLNSVGVQVVLVDLYRQILGNTFDTKILDEVQTQFARHGVSLALGCKVESIEDCGNDGLRVKTDHGLVNVDYAVFATGILPNTALFLADLDMESNGAIITDEYMQTSAPGVFAAGDCSVVRLNATGRLDYIPFATNAVRQGILAGLNIDGPVRKYPGTQSSSAVKLFGLTLTSTGLSTLEAAKRGVYVDSVYVEQNYRPDFMLTTSMVKAIMDWSPDTHEIIGAQFFAEHDVTQMANTVSMAIASHMTIDTLAYSDFLFQPNFSQPIDVVEALALKAVEKAKKSEQPKHAAKE